MPYAFAETMRRRMGEKHLNLHDLEEKLGWSFEHLRKLYNSEAFPSKPLRNALAEMLEIDPLEFEEQVNADRWREKFGKLPTIQGKVHPIYDLWEELSKEQQESLLCVARCMLKRRPRKAS